MSNIADPMTDPSPPRPWLIVLVILSLAGHAQLGLAETSEQKTPMAISASSQDPFLYDSSGRVRIFHGLNAIKKGYPWYPKWLTGSKGEKFIEMMQDLGLNVMRLGWMWSGFEPEPGQFCKTYYEQQLSIVDALSKAGIHTLLDAHQDCLSSDFCSYDGVPSWLLDGFEPALPYPLPWKGWTAKDCSKSPEDFGCNCFTEAAGQAYQTLYTDGSSMQDAFVNFWAESSQRWKDHPGILGYELINEPFPGNVVFDPSLLLPGVAGKKNLQPFYHSLARDGIRQYDKERLIFYEPVTWGMLFAHGVVGSGFTKVPGGNEYKDRSVLSYHYYCSSLGGDQKICNDLVGPQIMNTVLEDVCQTGGSTFMTEFGGLSADSCTSGECSAVMDLADQYLQSWMLWPGITTHDGVATEEYQAILSRSYARAIAGTPECMRYETDSGDFVLRFKIDATITAPTEIFVGAKALSDGKLVVETSPGLTYSIAPQGNLVEVSASDPSVNNQTGWVRVYRQGSAHGPQLTCEPINLPTCPANKPDDDRSRSSAASPTALNWLPSVLTTCEPRS